jgi:hypothetical protein
MRQPENAVSIARLMDSFRRLPIAYSILVTSFGSGINWAEPTSPGLLHSTANSWQSSG